MNLNGDVTGFWDNEFLDFDVDSTSPKLLENQLSNVNCQGFQQLPRSPPAEAEQSLADGVIIDRVIQVIAGSSHGDVGFHFHADQEALGMDPFLVRDADVVKDLKVSKCDDIHKNWGSQPA
jgi:hypothetical protein